MFGRNQELKTLQKKYDSLKQEHQILVEEVDQLKETNETLIGNVLVVPHTPNSFLFAASKETIRMLPTGFKSYCIGTMCFLVDEQLQYSRTWICGIASSSRYLSTEGGFAYLHGSWWITPEENDMEKCPREWRGRLLMEVVPDKETRIYPQLQQLARQHNKAILKVTFPEKIKCEAAARTALGMGIDPVVEVIFE